MEPSRRPAFLRHCDSSAVPRAIPSSASAGGGRIQYFIRAQEKKVELVGLVGGGREGGGGGVWGGVVSAPEFLSRVVYTVVEGVDYSPEPPLTSAPRVPVYLWPLSPRDPLLPEWRNFKREERGALAGSASFC